MPIYIYHCDNCGIQFEISQNFSDKPLKRCPECGKFSLHKVYTPVSVIYKGSGFYSTDYRSNSSAASTSHSKKKETSKTSKDNIKSSTKSSAKNS